MIVDLVGSLVYDYIQSRFSTDQEEEEQNIYFSYKNQTIEIYSIITTHDDKRVQFPNAKAKRIKSKGIWEVYCMGQGMTWQLYDPHPEVQDVQEFLKLIDDDIHGMFWG